MPTIAYDLVRKADNVTLQTWPTIPGRVDIPDDRVVLFTDGKLYDGDEYKIVTRDVADAPPPPLPPPPTKGALVDYANMKQWLVAVGGFRIEFTGGPTIAFATDETSMTLINGKWSRLQEPNAPTSFPWQTGPTTFVTLTAAQFSAAATAIADFVQLAFDALPGVLAAIEAETIKTPADIDAAAWPTPSVTI